MLTVFLICWSLMLYDTGYTNPGESQTIVSYNHIKKLVQRDVL